MKCHLLSFDTFAMDEVFLRVLDSFWFLLEEHRQWRVTERKIINVKEAGHGRNERSHFNQQLII